MKTNNRYEYLPFWTFVFLVFLLGSCHTGNFQLDSFSGLKSTDIGKATQPGMTHLSNDTLILEASGTDIWGKSDEFRFAYQEVNGDFNYCVKVIGLSFAHLYTKAGIMARSELNDSSKHVYFQVFPDNSPRNNNNGGAEFQYRLEPGAEMAAIYPDPNTAGTKFDVNFPNVWIRLERNANEFNAYFSNNGTDWNRYTTFQLDMPDVLYVGLAVTSHHENTYTTARFVTCQ